MSSLLQNPGKAYFVSPHSGARDRIVARLLVGGIGRI
jgi:hypothetical protein